MTDWQISIDPDMNELQRLSHDVADVRRLLLQDIFVRQSSTKTVDDMWARYSEARRSGADFMVKHWQQEIDKTRLQSELASCRAALQDAASVQVSLERRGMERDNEITRLKSCLSAYEDTNRDLIVCTARLSESIFDLSGATDIDTESERVRIRYDQLEIRSVQLQRLLARANEEKGALERQVQQWAESHHQLRAQSSSLVADRDRAIKMLQAALVENGLCIPDTGS